MIETILEPPIITFPSGKELPSEDGIPMESPDHRSQMNLLIDLTDHYWHDKTDYYVGGNMFVYFSDEQVRNKDYKGPDFFIVTDVDGTKKRDSWVVWEEKGRYPDMIVELLSATTAELDKTTKKRLYEQTFKTYEYYCYNVASHELIGWRMGIGLRYEKIEPNANGQLWSETIQLWLGKWEGPFQKKERVWLRFFENENQVVPTPAEAEAIRADRAEAELAQLRQEMARLQGKDS